MGCPTAFCKSLWARWRIFSSLIKTGGIILSSQVGSRHAPLPRGDQRWCVQIESCSTFRRTEESLSQASSHQQTVSSSGLNASLCLRAKCLWLVPTRVLPALLPQGSSRQNRFMFLRSVRRELSFWSMGIHSKLVNESRTLKMEDIDGQIFG